eukprot:4521027-Pyramimonas_sp.AAC.2
MVAASPSAFEAHWRMHQPPRKLQACPKKIAYEAMTPTGEVDLRSDSGYRRLRRGADDEA